MAIILLIPEWKAWQERANDGRIHGWRYPPPGNGRKAPRRAESARCVLHHGFRCVRHDPVH
jgi:hypothetical protein